MKSVSTRVAQLCTCERNPMLAQTHRGELHEEDTLSPPRCVPRITAGTSHRSLAPHLNTIRAKSASYGGAYRLTRSQSYQFQALHYDRKITSQYDGHADAESASGLARQPLCDGARRRQSAWRGRVTLIGIVARIPESDLAEARSLYLASYPDSKHWG